MLSASNLESIQSEGQRFVEAVRRDPDAPVPQYPGWSLSDLASHTASVHGRSVIICEELPAERVSAPRLPGGMSAIDWCEMTLARMVEAFRVADSTTPVWAFGPDQNIGFWENRMVIETGVHRWDADQAHGDPDPLTSHVAVAGLDEFADMWLPHLGEVHALETYATDLDRSWKFPEGQSNVTLSAPASDIYLALLGRSSPVTLPDEWHLAVHSLAPPPKR